MQLTSHVILSLSLLSSTAFAASVTSHTDAPPPPLSSEAPPPTPVVGGTLVPAGTWPDTVAVLADDAACSGTLIAPDVVLTAGHCIGVNPVEVIVNTTDYNGTTGEVIRVKSATAYPSWQADYDVGVLVLESAATTAKPRAIASACSASQFEDGTQVHVVGFGLTSKAGTGANSKLHQATIPVTDAACTTTDDCKPAIAPDGEFMAGGSGADACFGDSGGPVYLGTGAHAALIGVVSRGLEGTATPCGGGGIYVRADKVVAWIEKTTGRTIARASCSGKADGDADADAMGAGGCDAGGGSLGGGALAALAGLGTMCWVVRRRR